MYFHFHFCTVTTGRQVTLFTQCYDSVTRTGSLTQKQNYKFVKSACTPRNGIQKNWTMEMDFTFAYPVKQRVRLIGML